MPKDRRTATNTSSRPPVTMSRLFPNMVTILGLCAGLSSMRFALNERWEMAFIFILVAACIDAVDGRLARMLNATSEFGAQLDSLSDFLNFGVAPVFLLYLWKMQEIKGVGWAVVLFFAICCAIRLARFNATLDDEQTKKWSDKYFIGMPSPAAALIALGPLVIVQAYKVDYPEFFHYLSFWENPAFVCGFVAFIGILMPSRVPTFSFKRLSIPEELVSLTLVAAGLLFIALITELWITLSLLGSLYLFLSVPVSWLIFYREYRRS